MLRAEDTPLTPISYESPFRATSPVLYDRQVAALNMALLAGQAGRRDIYAGVCPCRESQQRGLLLIADGPVAECMFCGQEVDLARMLSQEEIAVWRKIARH